MAKREILGVMTCPECGATGAHIKAQRSGLLYRWCADGCNAQFFARNPDQEKAMRAALPKPAAPVTDTEPERRSYEGQAKVYRESLETPEPEPAKPAPKAKPASGFDILLGRFGQ